MRRVFICIGLCTALFAGLAQAATIYQWKDTQGTLHYGSQPPDGVKATIISTGKSNGSSMRVTPPKVETAAQPSKIESQAEIDARIKQQAADDDAKLKEYCSTMRDNLGKLRNYPRVMSNENGQVTRLTEEDRQARLAETEAKIAEICQDL